MLTVGEKMAEEGRTRGCLWAWAVLLQSINLAAAVVLLYVVYRMDTVRATSDPWRVLVLFSWAPYAVLGNVIVSYMELFLPLRLRNALIVVIWLGCGPLMLIAMAVYFYCHAWAVISMDCVFAVAIVGHLAFWIWLRTTYRAHD